ncbi:FAD-dependent oxidoreductase [Ectothiorhodospira haloalkaliphila]|uniref:NAD(P)/FAD-dependent oxidoreductase n=1 Tax=Ectothiorhodospira haloalkaliphila TaxID=421628 RepID=UPI001EE7BFAC|nr:FAD-dependent oxidoreductase [Ectothiorhodospira haloalkaliphila]MCG5524942.1 FAD-dependent oxidoreductase [Ectothiorhodospira haloalkaliphila]
MNRIAIIGAGMAGLAAARRLADQGHDCTVLEKSRGLGGRMATRHADALRFDHGAQYFTARGESLKACVRGWQQEGVVAEWGPDRLVGCPGMTAPAWAMARGLSIHRHCRITHLDHRPEGWHLQADAGPDHEALARPFDTVLLAIPAPQAMTLAATAGIDFPAMAQVRYAPTITLMAAFDHPLSLPDVALEPTEGPLAWIARNATKPGRDAEPETVVAHAGSEWSRAHLNTPAEELGEPLLEALRAIVGKAQPFHWQVHRWLYARVEQAAGTPCLWDAQQRIGACGDWALGARVEAAFDSGEALAAAVIRSTGVDQGQAKGPNPGPSA